MIDGRHYDSNQIVQIVKLQRMIRNFLKRRRAVQFYLSICPPELKEEEIYHVKVMLMRHGPFEYKNPEEEIELASF